MIFPYWHLRYDIHGCHFGALTAADQANPAPENLESLTTPDMMEARGRCVGVCFDDLYGGLMEKSGV